MLDKYNHTISNKVKALKKVFFCLFIAFCLLPNNIFASKPVTVIVSLSPPYTPFLNEYGSSGVDKLQVSLLVNDSRMVNYPAKLQMLIEHVGSGIVMRTSEYAAIAPIMLTGNVTEVFNGFDLNKYFLAQNNVFTGFDQSQYLQTGRIPDGQYRIGFRIVDAQRTDVVLSNTAYTQPGWFVLNDPPQINLPRNKEKVRVNDLQNVKLEWFPRHLGSLNAAFATSYQIELFAIRVPGMNPNQVAMSMQPDFTDVTNRTSYNLTNDKYMLEPGVEYAYRIKAMAGDNQLTLFQNDGYSEVFSFIYGSLCPETENVSAQTMGTDKVEISWDTEPLQTSFETRFRKAGQVNDLWHTRESFIGMTDITNVLSYGVKYEYQVKATCTTVESDYSPLDYFTMPNAPNTKFECGADDSVMVNNTIPKASLQEGEMIFYGQFPIKLTEVSGSNGVFTGKGRMRIPFLAYIQVNMQFNGIKVNELNEVYEGELVSIYNPDSKFLIDDVSDYFSAGSQVGNVITGEESAAITLGYVVDNASSLNVTVSGSTVTVTGHGGTVTTDIETATGGTTISDSEGNLYVVSEDGSVSQVGTSGGASDAVNYNNNSAAYNQLATDATIVFLNDDSDIWAFDEKSDSYENSTKINSEYEQLGDYYVPWKLIPEGKSGKVKAKITSGSIDSDKVVFKTPTGTEYMTNYNGSEFELTIVGSEHGDVQEIYALYEENDSTTKSLGKLKNASYNIIKGKLAIVPVGDAELSTETLKTQLDNIYLKNGIEWEVRSEPAFTDTTWAGDDGKLDGGESGFFSAYTAEMKALNNAFKAERTVNDDEVYLFVFNTEAANVESGVLLGDMPIGYQFGYLFSPSDDPITAKTIAHELAHGKLQLKHTFDASYGLDEGTTANLMDYSSGEELVKQQWDAIFDPQILIAGFLQDDEEGERKKIDSTYHFKIEGDTNLYYANSTLYHVISDKPLKIRLKSDSLLTCTWEYGKTTLSRNIDSCLVNIKSEGKEKLVAILPDGSEVQLYVKIYDPPKVEFYRGLNYNGEYGFDNYFKDYDILETNGNYEQKVILGENYFVPILSIESGQTATLRVKVKITNDMLRDSCFKLLFIDTLGVQSVAQPYTLVKGQNVINVDVSSLFAFHGTRHILIKDYQERIIGKLNVVSDMPINRDIKIVYVKSDSINFHPINRVNIQNQLNNNSYNQAFVNWNILPVIDTVDVINVFVQHPDWLNSSARTLQAIINTYQNSINNFNINGNPEYTIFISSLQVNADNDDGVTGRVAGRAAFAPSHLLGIFDGANLITYTHEMGHCAGLLHSWKAFDESIRKNSSENFMDYSTVRNYFWAWQWLIIKTNL